ncbi:hypothetical protein DEO72_LG1g2191 [Vigna unguiculata]|uniref:Uncharacterized protein n=1 Tax=Vigna unguiculata TaxID=3917 RepID=A0A4D6KPP6_VIGUN|nr:hypothetical protein DEO72_LG1g2191 [Vigna unguiculata]
MVAHSGARFRCGGGVGRSVVAIVTSASLSWWLPAMVGECCRWECAGCGQYGWVQMDCPPQSFSDEFGSPGTLRTMFVPGNSTWHCSV